MKPKLSTALSLALLAAVPLASFAAKLETEKQKMSYIIGYNVGSNLKHDGMDVDPEILLEALQDALKGARPQLSQEEMQATVKAVQQRMIAERKALAEKNEKAGQEFLAANKKKEGVKELPSGLQYKVIKAGTGKQPKANDTVTVNYRGTLISGQQFDSSYDRGEPSTLPVNGVIQGWQEALQLMKEGAKWQIYVPSKLAYGGRSAGNGIGPNETLIFDLELLKVNSKDDAPQHPAEKK